MNIKLLIAAHKQYQMPQDKIYLPLHVGAEGKTLIEGFTPDNTGDNISAKNPYYCELTGLYWAWKNLDADYIGFDIPDVFVVGWGLDYDQKYRDLPYIGVIKENKEETE